MLLCAATFPWFLGVAAAQRHGGASAGSGGLSSYSRPDGVDEKDSLKDFHRAMELQATVAQTSEFQAVLKNTETVKSRLHEYQQGKENEGKEKKTGAPAIGEAVENARSGTKAFLQGFSDQQKSGLKEATKRLEKSDSDLEQEEKKFDQSLQASGISSVEAPAEGLDKALTDFSNQLLALGREMGIIIASGQDSTFVLPAVKSSARIDNRAIAFTSAGQLSQTLVGGNQRTFKLQLTADLSDMQQKITELLHTELDRSDRCGERVAVQQAMLTPSMPASILFVRLHYERWICTPPGNQSSASEMAESDGSVELRLTPTWGKTGVEVSSQLGRIEGSAMMTDAVRQGSLGDDLREKSSRLLASCIQSGIDFKTALPAVVQGGSVVQNAKFADGGAGSLIVVLEGQTQLSDEQANLLASQLNQAQLSQRESNPALSTRGTAAQ